MKATFLKLTVVALMFALVTGCKSEPKDAAGYFKETDGTEDLIDGSYEVYDGVYYFYVDNVSPDKFISTDLKVTNKAEATILETKTSILRPGYYAFYNISEEPNLYYTQNLKYYSLKEPVKFKYGYIYDYSDDELYTDIFKAGGFTKDELEATAKQEYIISKFTNVLDTVYYYFDQDEDTFPGYSVMDRNEAIYRADVNYDEKTIKLNSISNGELTEIKTVKMPF